MNYEIVECVFCRNKDLTELIDLTFGTLEIVSTLFECIDTNSCVADVRDMMGIDS